MVLVFIYFLVGKLQLLLVGNLCHTSNATQANWKAKSTLRKLCIVYGWYITRYIVVWHTLRQSTKRKKTKHKSWLGPRLLSVYYKSRGLPPGVEAQLPRAPANKKYETEQNGTETEGMEQHNHVYMQSPLGLEGDSLS